MIGRLKGTFIESGPDRVLIDVSGVGYLVFVPESTLQSLPAIGQETVLHTHMHVREDMIALYGFSTRSELKLFETVVSVRGVGPRLGLTILSHLTPDAFVRAVLSEDVKVLTKVPGIGKKTAARILLELKDKIADRFQSESEHEAAPDVPIDKSSVQDDAVAALVVLGYSESEAQEAVRRASNQLEVEDAGSDGADADSTAAERLIREALKRLDRLS